MTAVGTISQKERATPATHSRRAVLDLRGALAALGLGGFLVYFGVARAAEAGAFLLHAGWRPGSPLPLQVPFAHAPGSTAAAAAAVRLPGAQFVPFDQALGLVLFCLAMGSFLCAAGLRSALRPSSVRH